MPPRKRALAAIDANTQRPAKRVNEGDKPRRERTDVKDMFASRAFEGQYEYICFPRPSWGRDDDSEEEDEGKPHKDDESRSMYKKPASEHPDWKWITMKESHDLLVEWNRLSACCNPSNFNAYIYNDFHGYGIVDLVLEEAIKAFHREVTPQKRPYNFHQMWAVVAALAHFLNGGRADAAFHVDDGEKIFEMISLLGCMILTALNEIERIGQLKAESEFRDLGYVMALWWRWGGEGLTTGLGDAEEKEDGEDTDWCDLIVAYAKKAGIELAKQGVYGLERGLRDVDVEALEGKAKVDRWGWKKMFKAYNENRMGTPWMVGPAGPKPGESFNFMEWTREERADAAFDKKDPLADFTDEQIASGELAMA
ncbi:hypothetical protein PRZ48_015016 [Zasmidium cellare]|uniref:Uncharacterized protein n=1 Tax=Zasmidium cellare TaxID=395010 RepID=A0ABR0DXE3_ZASCE|nr:hypothetical protein PRZ48_015016 [Zasmidium cellare]